MPSPDKSATAFASQPALRWRPLFVLVVAVVLSLRYWGDAFLGQILSPKASLVHLVPSALLTIEQRADKILAHTPLIDGHDDLVERVRHLFGNHIYTPEFKDKFEKGSLPDHLDMPRLRRGKQGGFFWSCWVDCPAGNMDYSNEDYYPVIAEAMSQIDVIHRMQEAYSSAFSPSTLDVSSALKAFRRHGTLLSPIGVEGLHMIGRNASMLRLFHSLGTKYATLTWNCHNAVADAAQVIVEDAVRVAEPYWGGLSELGTNMILEMNRLGMIVDLAHVHPLTMRDVLAGNSTKGFGGSLAPAIFSHSSAFALCPHPRNVPDDVLELVQKTGSVVMVSFVPQFTSCLKPADPMDVPEFDPTNSTLDFVVEHIMYIGRKIGFEHVGLGSDFDGMPFPIRGLEDVSKFPDLVRELLRQGLSDSQVGGITGNNVLRVWRNVEKVAHQLQAEGMLPLEDDI